MDEMHEWVHNELVRQGFQWRDIEDGPIIMIGGKRWRIVRHYFHLARMAAVR